jgi:phosphatidylglycerophosphatase A
MKSAPVPPITKRTPPIARCVATVFYVGHIPFAPGTFGSLSGLFFLAPWFMAGGSVRVLVFMCVLCCFIGLWATDRFLKHINFEHSDPKEIVIDEVLGLWLTVLLTAFWVPITWQILLMSFVAFRIFDIVKPFPIDYVDEQLAKYPKTAALGVMADDCLAALFAAFWVVVVVG